MRKLALVGIVVAAAGAIVAMRKQSTAGPTMWQKMQERMESMPEDFPPRVMFDNVAATRENTEQILELLRARDTAAEQGDAEVLI
jgi:hypothetical protein